MSEWTEEEAKTKWCPFAKADDYDGGGYSTSSSKPASRHGRGMAFNEYGAFPFGNCIGSRCMAWRWTDPAYKLEPLMTVEEARELGARDGDAPPCREVPTPNRRGRCGLAH